MVEQLKVFENNVLALEAYGGFTEVDEKFCQKLFSQKLEQGFDKVNILVKIDEVKITKSSIKALLEDLVWTMRNYKKMGRLAIVSNSPILEKLVVIDNFFYANEKEGRLERYFSISEMNKALDFINSN